MKKLFIAALITIAAATSAFAKAPTTESFISSFKSEFKGAENVSWIITPKYTKVSFILNDKKMDAFYSADGEFIASSKAVSLDELPSKAKKSITKDLAGFKVLESIRVESDEENAFYISAENDKETVILKVEEDGAVSVFKKTAK